MVRGYLEQELRKPVLELLQISNLFLFHQALAFFLQICNKFIRRLFPIREVQRTWCYVRSL